MPSFSEPQQKWWHLPKDQTPNTAQRGRTASFRSPRCPVAAESSRAPVPDRAPPPPPRRQTRGEESFPVTPRGEVSYLWAAHGSLCRNIAPWQVAASLAAPASPLPARRGRLQHPWQRGGQPGTGSREATPGQRQVGALEPPRLCRPYFQPASGQSSALHGSLPREPHWLINYSRPFEGVRAAGACFLRQALGWPEGNRHPA